MSFMVPEIRRCRYYTFEASSGEACFIPEDGEPETAALRGRPDGTILAGADAAAVGLQASAFLPFNVDSNPVAEITVSRGILGRLSAPGYLDCTEWTPFGSTAEAAAELSDDDDDSEE